MTLRVISPRVHGIADYALDASLVAIPLAAGFSGSALWPSLAVALANATYSFLTSYSAGVVPLIRFRTHLLVDFAVGVAFALTPFALGFRGPPRVFYLIVGVGVVLFVAASRPDDEPATVSPRARI